MPNRPRILLIDDDPLFRSLIVSLLRRDYVVSVASDGAEGFYKALEQPPAVAIIDVQMPGWDGLKTLKVFRAHPVLRDVRTVILTADASRGTVLAAIQGGAHDYVVKTSFSHDEFCRKLARLLSEEGAAPSADDSRPLPAERRIGTSRILERIAVPAETQPGGRDSEDQRLQQIIDGWE